MIDCARPARGSLAFLLASASTHIRCPSFSLYKARPLLRRSPTPPEAIPSPARLYIASCLVASSLPSAATIVSISSRLESSSSHLPKCYYVAHVARATLRTRVRVSLFLFFFFFATASPVPSSNLFHYFRSVRSFPRIKVARVANDYKVTTSAIKHRSRFEDDFGSNGSASLLFETIIIDGGPLGRRTAENSSKVIRGNYEFTTIPCGSNLLGNLSFSRALPINVKLPTWIMRLTITLFNLLATSSRRVVYLTSSRSTESNDSYLLKTLSPFVSWRCQIVFNETLTVLIYLEQRSPIVKGGGESTGRCGQGLLADARAHKTDRNN